MLKRVLTGKGRVPLYGSSMDARGMTAASGLQGAAVPVLSESEKESG